MSARQTRSLAAGPTGKGPASRRPRLVYVLLIALVVMFVLPLLWALSSSFKRRGDIFTYPPQPLPSPFTLENYTRLLETQPFWGWFATSTIVAVVSTAVSVFVCALAGFAFAKYRFRGKRLLFDVMFSSMAVPFAVIVVPLFVILIKAGVTNVYFSLIVPWVAPAFGIFMMRQYAEQAVPDSVLEAARIDGASEFGLFVRVVLPLLRPALGALAVWSFLNSYNSFFWPLIVVSDPAQYTLPLGIQSLYAAEARQVDLVLAASVLAAIPSLIMFILLRKQLLDGLTAGAVKS
ncbi:carbohydrate ABC transporter permease [Nonomuraea sp. NPDC049419]|uniref:carbohydrate ABC transporter permease n=1 Tax=Nonomuraea sp. NPDC049419 TaxID=3155772 RepID=UPI0034201BCE